MYPLKIVVYLLKLVMFHTYVSLPEGTYIYIYIYTIYGWWLTYPLTNDGLRQLGLWNSQLNGKSENSCSKPLTRPEWLNMANILLEPLMSSDPNPLATAFPQVYWPRNCPLMLTSSEVDRKRLRSIPHSTKWIQSIVSISIIYIISGI